jgi:hypothetical protein
LHFFVLLSLGVHIFRYEETVGGIVIVDLGPSGRALVAGLDVTLIIQIGPGFFAAIFLWMVATFEPDEWLTLFSSGAGPKPSGPPANMLRSGDNAVT